MARATKSSAATGVDPTIMQADSAVSLAGVQAIPITANGHFQAAPKRIAFHRSTSLSVFNAIQIPTNKDSHAIASLLYYCDRKDSRRITMGAYGFYIFYVIAIIVLILHFTGWLKRNNLEWIVLVLAIATFPAVILLK
jgi:hypothetical protein